MLSQKLLNYTSIASRRFISQSLKNFESKGADSAAKASSPSSQAGHSTIPGRAMYIPTNFDKWLLVWVKKYPKGQVPNKITEEVIYQAKSKARVKAANRIIIIIALMCVGMVFYAKSLVKQGDSIQKRRQDWHKAIEEEAERERQAAAQNAPK